LGEKRFDIKESKLKQADCLTMKRIFIEGELSSFKKVFDRFDIANTTAINFSLTQSRNNHEEDKNINAAILTIVIVYSLPCFCAG
jgi:hypothetical protein